MRLDVASHHNSFLLAILFFSVLIRVLFFYAFLSDNPCQLIFDSGHYHKVAVSIVEGNGIAKEDGSPQFYRLPGYPLFLAFCYKIFGIDAHKALLVQIILAAFIPLLIFYVSLALLPENFIVACGAAVVAAMHPGFLIFSGLVMSETLFMILFISFLFLFFKGSKNTDGSTVLAGFFLGLSSLVRPVGHFVLILSFFLIFVCTASWWAKIKKSTLLFFGWLMTVAAWLIRNYLLTGYLFFHTLSGVHFLNHAAIKLAMHEHAVSYQVAQQIIKQELAQTTEIKELDNGGSVLDIEECLIAEKIAVKYMLKNPWASLKLFIGNMSKTACSLYSSELLVIDSGGTLPSYGDQRSIKNLFEKFLFPRVHNPWLIAFIYGEIIFFMFLIMGFLGFTYSIFKKKNHRDLLVQFALFMALFIGLSLACGFARLRLPIELFLIIGASAWWTSFL